MPAPGAILLFIPGVLLFLAVLAVPVSVCVKYVKQQKRKFEDQIVAELEDSKAMKEVMDILTDVSHITESAMCSLQIDPGQYSCAINVTVRVFDIDYLCSLTIRNFRHFQEESISEASAGKISMQQLSEDLTELVRGTNQVLASNLLGQHQPVSYPFQILRELLMSTENGDVEITYPIVLEAELRKYRQLFLRYVEEKCPEIFLNCKIFSSSATYLTLYFTPVT